VGAVVLAAGESRRLAPQKLLLPFGEATVIGSVVGALEEAGLTPIVVVAGEQETEIREALHGRQAQVVRNPEVARGMLSSLRVGLKALTEEVGRFVIALGDQPRLRGKHVRWLLDEQARRGKGIAIACYGGKRGHPVAFAARYREGILAVGDDQTLRDLIHGNMSEVAEVECDSDAVICDVDTREDYEAELQRREADEQ
jgi:molybdenum cofactor cytidylyltransferase